MRPLLALSILTIFCSSADAATVRHSGSIERHPRPEHSVTAPNAPKGDTVPGWTDEETQKWLNDATRMVGRGA
jgi:hypothetical protein